MLKHLWRKKCFCKKDIWLKSESIICHHILTKYKYVNLLKIEIRAWTLCSAFFCHKIFAIFWYISPSRIKSGGESSKKLFYVASPERCIVMRYKATRAKHIEVPNSSRNSSPCVLVSYGIYNIDPWKYVMIPNILTLFNDASPKEAIAMSLLIKFIQSNPWDP